MSSANSGITSASPLAVWNLSTRLAEVCKNCFAFATWSSWSSASQAISLLRWYWTCQECDPLSSYYYCVCSKGTGLSVSSSSYIHWYCAKHANQKVTKFSILPSTQFLQCSYSSNLTVGIVSQQPVASHRLYGIEQCILTWWICMDIWRFEPERRPRILGSSTSLQSSWICLPRLRKSSVVITELFLSFCLTIRTSFFTLIKCCSSMVPASVATWCPWLA